MSNFVLKHRTAPRQNPLKTLLRKYRISQARAALALGISRPHLNQILLGQAPVSPDLAKKLSALQAKIRKEGEKNELLN